MSILSTVQNRFQLRRMHGQRSIDYYNIYINCFVFVSKEKKNFFFLTAVAHLNTAYLQ